GAGANKDTFTFAAAGSISGTVTGGAGGFDKLVVSAGLNLTVVPTVSGTQTGSIGTGGTKISYVQMEESATNAGVVFNLAPDRANTATLAASTTTTGMLNLTNDDGAFGNLDFAVPTTSVTVNLSNMDDPLTINALS